METTTTQKPETEKKKPTVVPPSGRKMSLEEAMEAVNEQFPEALKKLAE